MIRIVLLVLLSAVLAACSPDYNWREVAVGDGAVAAYFPDKPVTQVRPLDFSGHEIPFGLTSASVNGVLFTVAHAPLPEALRNDKDLRQAFAREVMRSLYRNLGAAEPPDLPPFGEAFMVEGKSGDAAIRLNAKVWLTDTALIEGMVTAEQAAFPEEQAVEFFRGLRVAR